MLGLCNVLWFEVAALDPAGEAAKYSELTH